MWKHAQIVHRLAVLNFDATSDLLRFFFPSLSSAQNQAGVKTPTTGFFKSVLNHFDGNNPLVLNMMHHAPKMMTTAWEWFLV